MVRNIANTVEKTEFDQIEDLDDQSSHADEILSTQNQAEIALPNVTEYEG